MRTETNRYSRKSHVARAIVVAVFILCFSPTTTDAFGTNDPSSLTRSRWISQPKARCPQPCASGVYNEPYFHVFRLPIFFHANRGSQPKRPLDPKIRLILSAKKSVDDDADDDDVPADWSEDDILAEFEGLDIESEDTNDAGNDEEVDEEDEDGESDEDLDDDTEQVSFRSSVNDDDDDDDLEIDELDLDEEDEEDDDDDSGDDIIGEFKEEEIEDWDEIGASLDADDEWDEDEGEYELIDQTDDPNYMMQKEVVKAAIEAADKRARDEDFDPLVFLQSEMTDEQARLLDKLPMSKKVEELARGMFLSEQDIKGFDMDKEIAEVSDLMYDDPYPRHEEEPNILELGTGLTDDDMIEVNAAYKRVRDELEGEKWDKVTLKDMLTDWDSLSNQTLAEMEACLEEIGGSAYNVTRWLLYDLDFNVSNLMLAAVRHNRDAPVLFQHWFPQLVTYERYQHARDRNFDFNWDDVERADMEELKRYYAGFGYDEIPLKAPAETGIISLEYLDEEEIKMAAFESWMTEVYNSELDMKDFDDDDMQDEDNIFSQFYDPPQHPDLPTFEDAQEDLEAWKEELGDDSSTREYRDMMGQTLDYEVIHDEEFQREFRGHLIVACTGDDSDLQVAEKITQRFKRDFGKQVFVETRVMSLARLEDNVFEVWLESYEIDLLHSKKRSTSNAKGWTGPPEVDDAQLDYLVDRVRFLISDDARYSYRMDAEFVE